MPCPVECIDPSLRSPPTPPWLDLRVDPSVLDGMTRVKDTHPTATTMVVHCAGAHDLSLGAGAAAFDPRSRSSLSIHIDDVSAATMYESELVAIWLALRLAKQLIDSSLTDISIFTPSQRAINDLRTPSAASTGQHLRRALWDYLLRLFDPSTTTTTPTVHIMWCPTNQGLKDHEKALDLAAKSSDPSFSTTISLPFSHAAAVTAVKRAKRSLTSCPPSETDLIRLRGFYDPKSTVKALSTLPRPLSTAIVQLRAGHSALNGHLHWCKRAASPNCELCGCPETVEHFLLICRRYNRPRSVLEADLKKLKAPLSLSTLLFNPSFFPLTATYIRQTWRFAYLRRPLPPHLPIIDSPPPSPPPLRLRP